MKKQTECLRCGGVATITGSEDDYTVTCHNCDPRGVVISHVVEGVPLPPLGAVRRDLGLDD